MVFLPVLLVLSYYMSVWAEVRSGAERAEGNEECGPQVRCSASNYDVMLR